MPADSKVVKIKTKYVILITRSMAKTAGIIRASLILFLFFTFLSFCSLEWIPTASATTYYVATNGNDSYDGLSPSYLGGSNGPFRTLRHAANRVVAGDTVRIRGGTYLDASKWKADGTRQNPIVITNYLNERPVIDGNRFTIPEGTYGALMEIDGDWCKVSNLQIHHSSWYGLVVDGEHCTVYNVYSRQNWGAGIIMSGSYGLIDNCRAWNNSLMNEYFQPHDPGTWASGIAVCRTPSYSTIRRCKVWDTWGQGIDVYEAYHITVEDCVAYNNQLNFYISDTKYILFQRNLAYCTPGNMIQGYMNQNNILMGDEKQTPPSSHNTVINNLCMGGERNIFVGRNVFENCLVANNIFVNASNTAGEDSANISIHDGSYTNARFMNNIVLQEDNVPIADVDATGITFEYNNWSKRPQSRCRGTGDVIANPKLAKTGPKGPGSLTPEWFMILENSPAKDRAKVLSEVIEDFFKNPRGSKPDMGAFELAGGPSPLRATASGSPTQGQVPLTVNFQGGATGGMSPYSYNWNFDDGGSSTSQNPSHTYSSSGTYSPTLTVTDAAGSQASQSVTINVISDHILQNLSLTATTGNPAPGIGGTTDPVPGNHSYFQGSFVSVTSIPRVNYRFSVWEGDVPNDEAYDDSLNVHMDRDKSLSALFCTKCGDANGDLDITGHDAQTAFDMYLNRISDPPLCQFENADVNGSGMITPADAQAIFNKFLGRAGLPGDCSGKTRALVSKIVSVKEELSSLLLIVEDVRVNSEGYAFVPIIIDNSMGTDAFGLDLAFPANSLTYLTLESAELTQGYDFLDEELITSPEMDPQILRIGGFRTSQEPNPSYGVLLTLVFKATEELQYPVRLSVIATYDDIQKASVIDGMIYPGIRHPDRDKQGMGKKVKKKLPAENLYF